MEPTHGRRVYPQGSAVGQQWESISTLTHGWLQVLQKRLLVWGCPLAFWMFPRLGLEDCTLLTAPLPSLTPRPFQHTPATRCAERTPSSL